MSAAAQRILFLGPEKSPVCQFLREQQCDVVATEEKLSVAWVEEHKFDWLVSFGYRHIVRPPVLKLFPGVRRINLHISFLPFNRGADPNLWSLLSETPSGVTIHILDEGLDTGMIVAQRELQFDDAVETLASSYQKLQTEIVALFKETWGKLVAMDIDLVEQEHSKASEHRAAAKGPFFDAVTPNGWETLRKVVKQKYEAWCEVAGAGDVFKP